MQANRRIWVCVEGFSHFTSLVLNWKTFYSEDTHTRVFLACPNHLPFNNTEGFCASIHDLMNSFVYVALAYPVYNVVWRICWDFFVLKKILRFLRCVGDFAKFRMNSHSLKILTCVVRFPSSSSPEFKSLATYMYYQTKAKMHWVLLYYTFLLLMLLVEIIKYTRDKPDIYKNKI